MTHTTLSLQQFITDGGYETEVTNVLDLYQSEGYLIVCRITEEDLINRSWEYISQDMSIDLCYPEEVDCIHLIGEDTVYVKDIMREDDLSSGVILVCDDVVVYTITM